jgi:hypothetical protein
MTVKPSWVVSLIVLAIAAGLGIVASRIGGRNELQPAR